MPAYLVRAQRGTGFRQNIALQHTFGNEDNGVKHSIYYYTIEDMDIILPPHFVKPNCCYYFFAGKPRKV